MDTDERRGCGAEVWLLPQLRGGRGGGPGAAGLRQQLRGEAGERAEEGPPQPFSDSGSGSVPWKTKRPGGRGGEGETRQGPREPAVPFSTLPEEPGRAGSIPLKLPVKGQEGPGRGTGGRGAAGRAGSGEGERAGRAGEGGRESWRVIHGSGMRRAGPAHAAPGLPPPAPARGQ